VTEHAVATDPVDLVDDHEQRGTAQHRGVTRPELDRHFLPATEVDLRFAGRIVLKAPGDTGRGKT